MVSNDFLLTLAEVAIALAGFSAIVVGLRRTASGGWAAGDRDRFHGMVVHSIAAVGFSFLPALIDVVVQDPVTSVRIGCGLLGVQILVHCICVMVMPTSAGAARPFMAVGMLFGLLQFAAFTDWGAHRELDLYVAGIIWHILQAGVLFVMLVWIGSGDVDRR